MRKLFFVLVAFLGIGVYMSAQKEKDFENWVKTSTFNQEEHSYHKTITNFICTQSNFLKYFSKRTDIALIDYSPLINSITGKVYVNKFSFRYVKWQRGGNFDKKDNIVKAFEAGIENANNYVCYAYIQKREKPDKIEKWFNNNTDYKIINKEDIDNLLVIAFSLKEKEKEAKAYLEKTKIFNEATSLEKMVAARKKYPEYKIPLSIKETADRLACRCYLNPELPCSLCKKYFYYNVEEKRNLTFEEFLSAFPEYKNSLEFKTEFFKLLELNNKYDHYYRVERVTKFIELFEDIELAKEFVLNSVGPLSNNVLWCGLKLTDIFEIFGEDDELFTKLVTKEMRAVDVSEMKKYLNMTQDYKIVEEYIYRDYEKTEKNPFRTWVSWLDRAKELRPLLENKVDLARIDKCIQNVTAILEERARLISEALIESNKYIDSDNISTSSISKKDPDVDPNNVKIPSYKITTHWTKRAALSPTSGDEYLEAKFDDGKEIEISRYTTNKVPFIPRGGLLTDLFVSDLKYNTDDDAIKAAYVLDKYGKIRTIGEK